MASSIPAALDYLAAQITALPATASAVVSDGWAAQRSDTLVTIGIDPEETDSAVTVEYAELSGEDYEAVEVPSLIAVRRVGDGAAATARADALAILDAIRELIRADRHLGGAVRTGMPARLASWTMSQTATPQEAGEGRWCQIKFVVAWQHRG